MRLTARGVAIGGRTVVWTAQPGAAAVPVPALVGVVAGDAQPFVLGGVAAVIGNQDRGGQASALLAAPITGAPVVVLDPLVGGNRIGAAGAFWAAQTSAGYRDSRGTVHADWSLLAVDDLTARVAVAVISTGALAVWDGATLVTVDPSGADSWEDGDMAFRAGLLVYRKHGAVVAWSPAGDAPSFAQVPGQGVRYSRGWLLQWQDGRGLSVRRASETRGMVLSADGHDFGADLRLMDDGTLVVVSSAGEGEQPSELRRYVIDPIGVTVNGRPIGVVDLLAPIVTAPMFAPRAHPCGVVVADEPGGPDLAGPSDLITARTVGLIVTLGLDDVQQAGARAIAHRLPLWCYVDAADFPPSFMPRLTGDVTLIPTLRNYPEGAESPAETIARLGAQRAAMDAAGYDQVACCVAVYRGIRGDGTYAWAAPDVLDRLAGAWALGFDGLWAFEYTRAGGADGVVACPAFAAAIQRMRAATPQTFPTARPPVAPPVRPPVQTEDDMPNPTDTLTYTAVDAALAPRAVGRTYTDGCLDAYRLLAEGTPLAAVLAGESAPTQTPIPDVVYVQWAAVALGLLAARQAKGTGAGYGAGVMDTFRRFGGERWPLEYIMADIEDVPPPARPWQLF